MACITFYDDWGGHIIFHVDDLDNFQSPNCYFQSYDARITIGFGVQIAQSTGIITSNHDIYDLKKRGKIADVTIGNYCWIGMHCMLLPGVVLGDHTIVGAGSVVTHSVPEGYCIIAGNPAKIIKRLDKTNWEETVSGFEKHPSSFLSE